MERHGWNLRDNNNNSHEKVREPWSYNHHGYLGGGDYSSGSCLLAAGLSWPPRSYTCSFCKREFRSAQALGGHMNVHRRDRARLRETSPWDAPPFNPYTNPNPNTDRVPIPNLNHDPDPKSDDTGFSSPSPAPKLPQVSHTFSSLTRLSSLSSSTSSVEAFCAKAHDAKNSKAMKALFGVGEVKGLAEENETNVLRRKRGVVTLELEIGMCGEIEEDLDLELRLGHA